MDRQPHSLPIGASLLALLVVLALILIPVVAIIWPAYQLTHRHPGETWCVRGYLFEATDDGRKRQVFDDQGHAVPCDVVDQ
jgi:hypothetical protein